MVAGTHIERYPVRSYDVDVDGRLTLPAVCNNLQESAGLHARQLGVSVEQLLEEGMTWFLWRLHLRIERLPVWTETVTVETWPAELGRPYAIRDFQIRVGDEEVGVATSAWLLMDVAKKRPIRRLPPRILALHQAPPRRALNDRFQHLDECVNPSHQRQLTVRRSDLDLNGHLNHVAAINAMLESVPADLADELRIESLEIELKGEGHYDDVLASRCSREACVREPDGGPDPSDGRHRLVHGLVRPADGSELARGRSRWRTARRPVQGRL